MKPEVSPIIPVDQVVISFAGHEFLVVRFSDGRVAVVLRHLCEALDIDRWSQTRRIQSHPVLSKSLLLAQIETPGGPQVVNVLVTWAMPLWLGGFDLTRLSEEKRELIMLLQTDAVDAFNSHFYKADIQARPQEQAKAHQSPPPLPPRDEPPPSVAEMRRALANRIEQEDQRGETRLTRVEQELEGQQAEGRAAQAENQRRLLWVEKEIEALWAVLLVNPDAPPGALSPDHERTMHLFLRACHIISGQPIADLEYELAALMGVADVTQIPEAAWDRLLGWFAERLY
ncbi:MAG TPA: phage antirepressor N-terminal domain-containing protein [Ktedonobacterales bacterium]|jgi:hypothetical protein